MLTASKTRSADRDTGSAENIVAMYLKDITRIPLLTRTEEQTAARAAAQGDEAAKNTLIKANLRFVVNVAKKYQNHGLPLSDLISEGNIGLMNAIKHYNVDLGYHFISYAVWWIRQAILKAICDKSRMIRLPLNRANELVQIEKARRTITSARSDDEELQEVADLLSVDKKRVSKLLEMSSDYISLDSPVYPEKDSSSLSDVLEDHAHERPEAAAARQGLHDDINGILKTLTSQENEVIQLRFGLNGRTRMSLVEIGTRYRVTKERIRQIEKKAIRRLRHPTRSHILELYLY